MQRIFIDMGGAVARFHDEIPFSLYSSINALQHSRAEGRLSKS